MVTVVSVCSDGVKYLVKQSYVGFSVDVLEILDDGFLDDAALGVERQLQLLVLQHHLL